MSGLKKGSFLSFDSLKWIKDNRKDFSITELIKMSSEKLELNNIQIDLKVVKFN